MKSSVDRGKINQVMSTQKRFLKTKRFTISTKCHNPVCAHCLGYQILPYSKQNVVALELSKAQGFKKQEDLKELVITSKQRLFVLNPKQCTHIALWDLVKTKNESDQAISF